MKRILFLLLAITLAFASCKKSNNNNDETEESVLSYYPLKVGNFWVYERSLCDSTWTDCTWQSTDTCIITKDTIIADNKYFKIEGRNLLGNDIPIYLRDSSYYIIDNFGNIHMTITDFDNILYERYILDNGGLDTLFHIYRQMKNYPNYIITPAGSFNCLDNRTSLFRIQDNFNKEFNAHYYFTKNVGPVYENAMFGHGLGGFKKELKSYNVILE